MRSGLSSKQARFVAEYLVDSNGTRAAIEAGYGRAGAHVAASRLLSNDKVRAAIEMRQNADAARLGLQRQDVIQGLLQAIRNAEAQSNPAAMIRGWAEVARMLGLRSPEVHRVNLQVGVGDELRRFERMSDMELQKLIAGEAVPSAP
jgi:phage terminase small subunit